jgi:molybdopterin-containing oxidoreductase family membrane subunit
MTVKFIAKGNKWYHGWLAFLSLLIMSGIYSYFRQVDQGLILTHMRDQVSWGFYISNFTFLVGVAAAAVLLVIPAYVYNFKPIKEIVLLGEMLAITAIVMCLLFVVSDMGRPERGWHILPFLGTMNFPSSLLAWDVIVLNGYLVLNCIAVFYVLYKIYLGKEYKMSVLWPIVILSIPWAISIHTVTAFLYNGLSSRPFWNASILAPRFIASALCSGPALMILLFQIVRKVSRMEISNTAIFKVSELIAYAMGINLFLFAAEFFKEFYSGSVHLAPMKYLYFGLHGHSNLTVYMWVAFIFNLTAFFIFLRPKTRENFFTLNLACVLIITGVYIEKGMGLIIPGFIPGVLGEIYEYGPSDIEKSVALGIWATGALLFTLFLKFALPIYTGEVRYWSRESGTG